MGVGVGVGELKCVVIAFLESFCSVAKKLFQHAWLCDNLTFPGKFCGRFSADFERMSVQIWGRTSNTLQVTFCF